MHGHNEINVFCLRGSLDDTTSTLSNWKVVPHPDANLGVRKSANQQKNINIGTNRVEIARHGLILRINGATEVRMLLQMLLGRFDGDAGPNKFGMLGTTSTKVNEHHQSRHEQGRHGSPQAHTS